MARTVARPSTSRLKTSGGTGGGGGFLPTAVRRASPDERSDAAALSILLFVVGLGLIALGAVIDPNHKLV